MTVEFAAAMVAISALFTQRAGVWNRLVVG